MDTGYDLNRLMRLRGLTSALASHFEATARGYLAALAPMLQPRSLLGDLIRAEKAPAKDQDTAFRELVKLYQPIARQAAINTQVDLKPPLDIYTSTIDIAPASYTHTPEGSGRPITIVTPLKWVVSYKDLGIGRLREQIAGHARSGGNELQTTLLQYLTLHLLLSRRPGPASLIEALRFGLESRSYAEFGGLPVTHLVAPVPTVRPPDLVIVQSTTISGAATFEEVVDLEAIEALRDPLKERVLALLAERGAGLAPSHT